LSSVSSAASHFSASYGFWYGFPFWFTGFIMLLGYIFLGTIMSTNQLLSQQRIEEAEARLKLTFFPKLLLVGYKGVYYMTYGCHCHAETRHECGGNFG
jgi:hypothetical protein